MLGLVQVDDVPTSSFKTVHSCEVKVDQDRGQDWSEVEVLERGGGT